MITPYTRASKNSKIKDWEDVVKDPKSLRNPNVRGYVQMKKKIDQIKVKTKWEFYSKAIKKRKSKKYDEKKEHPKTQWVK